MLVRLHSVMGLVLGAVLLVIGLTGSLLVFREAIERSLSPNLWQVPQQSAALPLHDMLARLEQIFPEDRLFALRMPRERGEALVAWMNDEHGLRVYLDPYSGRVLDARDPKETFTGFLFALHTSLLAGEAGESLNGVVGLGSLGLVLTGALLWRPSTRAFRAAVTIRHHNRTAMLYGLHTVMGIAAVIPLGLLVLTGAALVFYSTFQLVVSTVTGDRLREPLPQSLSQPASRPSIDLIIQAADAALPGAITTWILFPREPTGVVTVRRRFAEEWHPNGRSFVRLDQYSGKVLAVENALHASVGRRIENLLYPLHIGRFEGVAWQVLYVLAGLTPGILFLTGWLMRRRKHNSRD